MKKIIILLLTHIILLSGCSITVPEESDKMQIVCTSFPYYDFARSIAGEAAEVSLLVPVGTDIHAFDPTPKDMLMVESADIFIANGGDSDEWVRELLKGLEEKPDTVLYMLDYVPLLKNSEHTDEHIWTSPENAKVLTAQICDAFIEKDAENEKIYSKKLEEYTKKLDALDDGFKNAVENGKRKTVVFGDRFPFIYLTKEYGLEVKAAFSGCSELTEPTAKVVSELVEAVREEQIPAVFYVEFSNRKICDAICGETGAKPLLMHSVHNLTRSELDLGADYISIMSENIKALEEALG